MFVECRIGELGLRILAGIDFGCGWAYASLISAIRRGMATLATHECASRGDAPGLDHPWHSVHRQERLTTRTILLFVYLCLSLITSALAQITEPRTLSPKTSHTTTKVPKNAHAKPKCMFLREEYRRIKEEADSFLQASPFRNISTVSQLSAMGASIQEFAD